MIKDRVRSSTPSHTGLHANILGIQKTIHQANPVKQDCTEPKLSLLASIRQPLCFALQISKCQFDGSTVLNS
ncbi:hypothetical protein BKE30_14405 [Alkanindiges hydrocarboniclasticus]|uniref:Uncharacterized protein n=1 Tax=Alkanindiges hydrocarboniclasticus TaxID=1907941 RepID=A0A1S8CQG1_9GAMM|nr:hypothetical protein BKE30_14405 [Alkanindiges hydrocarboniclasticus]